MTSIPQTSFGRMLRKHLPLAALTALLHAGSIWAAGFTPPAEIRHGGKTYQLAYQTQNGPNYFQYEYTTDQEPVEHWSSLVTLIHMKNAQPSPQQWVETMEQVFRATKPTPLFSTFVENGHGYAMILFPPAGNSPMFEADIQKTFHIASCQGLITYQFGLRHPDKPELAADRAAYQAFLKTLVDENIQLAEAARTQEWSPQCSAE